MASPCGMHARNSNVERSFTRLSALSHMSRFAAAISHTERSAITRRWIAPGCVPRCDRWTVAERAGRVIDTCTGEGRCAHPPPSSSGPGCRILSPKTGVQIPVGVIRSWNHRLGVSAPRRCPDCCGDDCGPRVWAPYERDREPTVAGPGARPGRGVRVQRTVDLAADLRKGGSGGPIRAVTGCRVVSRMHDSVNR